MVYIQNILLFQIFGIFILKNSIRNRIFIFLHQDKCANSDNLFLPFLVNPYEKCKSKFWITVIKLRNLLSIIIIMGKIRADEEYDNDKQLKKNHTVITPKKKEKLIELVIKDGLTIYRAAKRLKICHPTAKFIIKTYRQGNQLLSSDAKQLIQEGQEINGKNKVFQDDIVQKQSIKRVSFTKEEEIQTIQTHSFSYMLPTQQFWTFYGYECMPHPLFFTS